MREKMGGELLNKSVIIKILQDAENEARHNQYERRMYSFKRARISVEKYPNDCICPEDVLNIKYIGKTITNFIEKKLSYYNNKNGGEIPNGDAENVTYLGPTKTKTKDRCATKSSQNTKNQRSSDEVVESSSDLLGSAARKGEVALSEKRNRVYTPRVRSGNWAILLALYIHAANGQAIEEPLLKTLADQYSKESMFTNSQRPGYYCAFSTFHKKLIEEEKLVIKRLGPKRYILSPKGREMAARLYEQAKDILKDMNLKNPVDNALKFNDENQVNGASQLIASKNSTFSHKDTNQSCRFTSGTASHSKLNMNGNRECLLKKGHEVLKDLSLSDFTTAIAVDDDDDLCSMTHSSQATLEYEQLGIFSPGSRDGDGENLYLNNDVYMNDGRCEDFGDDRLNDFSLHSQVRLEDGLNIKLSIHKIVNVVVVVDNREKRQICRNYDQDYFKTSLGVFGLTVDIRALPLGDFLWIGETETGEEVVLDFLVERKISTDLASSIIDRRYCEQKWRIRHSGMARVCYLIEGSLKGFQAQKSGLKVGSLSNSVLSTEYVDELMIFRTRDIKDTITHLYAITKWIEMKYKNKTVYTCEDDVSLMLKVRHNGRTSFELEYGVGVIGLESLLFTYYQYLKHNVKTRKLPMVDLFGKQLMNIPNVSSARAGALVKRFKTPMDLYNALKVLPNREERVKLISNISFEGRCMGKTIANHILSIYYPE